MNIKDTLQKIGVTIVDGIMLAGSLAWSLIKGLGMVITFLIIFVLLSAILPFSLIGILLSPIIGLLMLVLLLWLVYTHRHKVATIIAVLIVCGLALMLFNRVKYSLFPDWAITKYSSFFRVHSSFGLTEIKNETLNKLTCYGATDLDDVLVNGPLTIYGRLDADALKVQGKINIYGQANLNDVDFKNDLTVYGRLNLEKGLVSGETTIHGRIHVKESHLNDLVVYAKKINLTSSTAKNIYVKGASGKTTVTLVGSKVEGDIVFDGGNGRVVLEHDSSVGGRIIGDNVGEK